MLSTRRAQKTPVHATREAASTQRLTGQRRPQVATSTTAAHVVRAGRAATSSSAPMPREACENTTSASAPANTANPTTRSATGARLANNHQSVSRMAAASGIAPRDTALCTFVETKNEAPDEAATCSATITTAGQIRRRTARPHFPGLPLEASAGHASAFTVWGTSASAFLERWAASHRLPHETWRTDFRASALLPA